MCDYYEKIKELSRRITEWSIGEGFNLAQGRTMAGTSRYRKMLLKRQSIDEEFYEETISRRAQGQVLFVCTGGGPGFMEAANEGASLVPFAKNIGMGITLPFESGLNRYVTQDLAFEFHYFFTRKFWMVYHCQALIVAPGGMGTHDELFEVLTLRQTGKIQQDLPVILFGVNYWKNVINWNFLMESGTISENDISDLFFTDSVDDAFDHLINRLSERSLEIELK